MWRVEMPAQHLDAKVMMIPDQYAKRVFSKPQPYSKYFPWVPTEEGAHYPAHEGVAVWTRPDMVRATHACAMSAQGIRIVCEVDDNYLSDKNQNIFMRMNNYGPLGRRSHMQAFATFDTIICSTNDLRDIYAKTFKKELGYVPDIRVARNHVDPDTWTDRRELPGTGLQGAPLRVGWAGSHQHIWDLRLAAPALRLAADAGCELVFIGLDPATHDPNWRNFLGPYTHIPWQSADHYHQHSLPIDIGLIPLVYNHHTMGKSDIKWIEMSMSGAATVVQNHPIYNKTVVHNETGLLAGSPDEMALQLDRLIRDKKLRSELTANAQEHILAHRTIQGNIHEWKDAILG